MGESINRRDFLRVLGAGVAASVLPTVPATFGCTICIDDLTEKTLNKLSKLSNSTIGDIEFYKPYYRDDASVKVNASIGDFLLEYSGSKHHSNEKLKVSLGRRYWEFCTEESTTIFGRTKVKKTFKQHRPYEVLNPEKAGNFVERIKDLLDVDFHKEQNKGIDQTDLVNDLVNKVLSVKEFDVEYDQSFPSKCKALHQNGDFKIECKLEDTYANFVEFTIQDGEKRLSFKGKYDDKDGNPDEEILYVNQSQFKIKSRKLREFPTGVYTKDSASYLVNNIKSIANHLNSTIKNTKLENYTDIFERLTSTDLKGNDISRAKKGLCEEVTINEGNRIIKYLHARYSIDPFPTITLTAPNPENEKGYDEIHFHIFRDEGNLGEVERVIINGHCFNKWLSKDVAFIRSTYTTQQANFIIEERSQEFYKAVTKLLI